MRRIPEPQALFVAARLGNRREQPSVDRRPVGPHRGHGCRAQGIDAPPQSRRHDLDDFGQRSDRRLFDARHRALRRGPQADCQRNCLLIVEQQRGQGRARGELIAAVDAALRVDWITELAQPIDVAAEGAHRNFQALGQLVARPIAVRLEER